MIENRESLNIFRFDRLSYLTEPLIRTSEIRRQIYIFHIYWHLKWIWCQGERYICLTLDGMVHWRTPRILQFVKIVWRFGLQFNICFCDCFYQTFHLLPARHRALKLNLEIDGIHKECRVTWLQYSFIYWITDQERPFENKLGGYKYFLQFVS